MQIKPNSDGDQYDLRIDETERRVMVDALTNLSLDAARGATDAPDHDGRAAPSADVCGSYLDAANVITAMAKVLKEGY